MTLRISVEGELEVEQELSLLAAKFDNLMPLMDVIGAQLAADTEDNFKGEHGPDGTPWLPSIRARETGGKTLQDSRRLYESIGWRAGAKSVEVGTNVIYAARHQQGFQGQETVHSHKRTMSHVFGVKLMEPLEVIVPDFTRAANTPARPFLGLSPHSADEIRDHVADFLAGSGDAPA